MSRKTRSSALFVLVLAVSLGVSSRVSAQTKGAYEFGIDAGFNLLLIDDVDDNLLSVGLPASSFGAFLQNLRVGYYVTEFVELETTLGFSYLSDGADTFWRGGIGLDLLYNLSNDAGGEAAGFFLKTGFLMDVYGDENTTETQLGIGMGGGTRLPVGNRFAIRLEAGGARRFENDDFLGTWQISGRVGLSFFTQ